MAHLRRPLGIALGLNSAVIVVEVVGTLKGNSLSLLLDAVHNVSDEMALLFLFLAYSLRRGISGRFLRYANLLNSIGILAICALLSWQIMDRIFRPAPLVGAFPIIAGLLAAILNWGVAKVLQKPSEEDASIRLAYAHNLGDTLVSLGPVVAGLLSIVTGRSVFDPLIAGVIAALIMITTVRAVAGSHKELLWPENVSCGHFGTEK